MYLVECCSGNWKATGCIFNGVSSIFGTRRIQVDPDCTWRHYEVDIHWTYDILPNHKSFRVYKLEVLDVSS